MMKPVLPRTSYVGRTLNDVKQAIDTFVYTCQVSFRTDELGCWICSTHSLMCDFIKS